MKNRIPAQSALLLIILAVITSCSGIPGHVKPVENFNIEKYLGTWYEIARFDYKFERNLNNVAAQYSLKANGEINVFNTGYNFKTNEWKSASGTGKFREAKNKAALKVTFFKPFYAGYNVIALDENYRYALVAGSSLDYVWFLSREKTMPENVKQQYLQIAQQAGYNTARLIWVQQNKPNPLIHER